MPELNQTSNCGIYEISGIRHFGFPDPEAIRNFFLELDDELRHHDHANERWKWPGMLLFSDARGPRSHGLTMGERFADYIMGKHLGAVTWSSWKRNPNTNNKIKMWMWYPNPRRCDALIAQFVKEGEVN